MGCGSTHFKIEGKIIKQEKICLEITSNHKNKELSQAQILIQLIVNIRNKIIYEFDNLIYISGACLFKNPTMSHCTKCILFKIASECQGDINKAEFEFKEDPPFFKINPKKFSKETNKIIDSLFEFIIRLRDYKILIKQIDKETPKLMYIVFENKNQISKENIDKINRGIILFKDISKLRNTILMEYRNQMYELVMNKETYSKEINKIGETAFKKKIKDIYEITMLFKDIINENEKNGKNTSDFRFEDLDMYNNIKEAKKIMEKRLEEEKVEDIDSSLLTFSMKRTISVDDIRERDDQKIYTS